MKERFRDLFCDNGRFGTGLATILFVLTAIMGGAFGCGSSASSSVAAVSLASGEFGAMMTSSEGQLLLPMVSRDNSGAIVGGVNGVLWMDTKGSSITVLVDPVTNLPTRTVMGDYVLVFGNWDTNLGTVDIAKIYGPTGYVELYRDVSIPDVKSSQTSGVVVSALTCFPACDTDLENTAELFKIGGTALSIGACVGATTLTLGAMALPCAGALVSAAILVTPKDLWLEDLEQTGRILALTDALECVNKSPLDCVLFFNTVATEAMDIVNQALATQEPLISVAEDAIFTSSTPEGVVQGDAPTCTDYECTPGTTSICYPQGTRECSENCRWGKCPSTEPQGEGITQCSDPEANCECASFQSCVTVSVSDGCVQTWYKTSMGNFFCASCTDCQAAAMAVIGACCTDE